MFKFDWLYQSYVAHGDVAIETPEQSDDAGSVLEKVDERVERSINSCKQVSNIGDNL